jgi:predicted enzyme related to lactoylglutathione lyase
LGGVFFKSENPTELKNWYKKHLNIPTDQYGWSFEWQDKTGTLGTTQWSTFKKDTDYFEPSQKQFMLNYRVENLEELLAQLHQENVTIVGTMQTFSYGKFAWILDLEQNKIELWEPIDKAL